MTPLWVHATDTGRIFSYPFFPSKGALALTS